MNVTARLLCLLVALILFVVGALWSPPQTPRPFNLVSAGLAFFVLSFMVP